MSLTGEYEPSPRKWVREQVERYEATDGREANTLPGTRRPVVIFTTRGRKSGKIRKFALMRVEHDGKYAMVGSVGGGSKHPEWYRNLKADPEALMVQDGAERFDATARELQGEERVIWWQRAVEAYPTYAKYQERTERQIPVLLVERRDGAE
ncbi:MAG TPA: nitroreductase family deazaflavin-dependent oxidoreductase [Propionibacteriaceae bacterium]|nr:nitroreductase family deazaflavin-dependent oxidoreductase [Propionibacteriaceae bacterium]